MKKSKKTVTWIISLVVIAVLALIIFGWDGIKKGASDAWDGNYDPPSKTEASE